MTGPWITGLTVLRLSLAVLVVACASTALTETDVWGHLRFGLDFLDSWSLPETDRYAFTSDQTWVNHEWAAQALLALAYRWGGLPGLTLFRAFVASLFLAVLCLALRRTAWPLRDVLAAASVAAAFPLLHSVRPQLFSLPLYTLVLWGLSRNPWWVPFVFLAWANLHGGWLLGLGAVSVWTALRISGRRLAVLAASSVATLVNPYGAELWSSLASAVRRGWGDVSEWQPVTEFSLGASDAVLWLTLVLGGFLVARRGRASAFSLLWTGLVAIAAFRARRHVPFLGVSIAVLLGAAVPGREPRLEGTGRWTPASVATSAFIVVAFALAGLGAIWPTVTCMPPDPRFVRPEAAAVRFIRDSALRGRVVMWFDWGLYAIWHAGDLLKVSIDNRRETVYSERVLDAHRRFWNGRDPGYPDRIHADYVWLPPGLPPVGQLLARGWRMIYEGPRSVILARRWTGGSRLGVDDALPPCFPQP